MNEKEFKPNWPRIKNLPIHEQHPFLDFLHKGPLSTPHLEGVEVDEQDGYYESDYFNFKNIPPTRYWD